MNRIGNKRRCLPVMLALALKGHKIMKWEPSDIIRFTALIGAFLLSILGALMMWRGIAAEGAIDIKSSVLTGSIKTGSAGLFITFLAFVIIVFVLSSLVQSTLKSSQPLATGHAKSKRIAKLLIVLFVGLIVSAGLAAFGYARGFAILAGFFGFLLIPVGIAYLAFLENER
jgi:hypothetical protein